MSFNLFNWSLRSKLLSIVFLILLIPVIVVELLKEVETTMVTSLKNNLLLSSNLVSLQLSLNPDWFNEIQLPTGEDFVAKEIFVFPLNRSVKADGFLAEWEKNERFRQSFYPEPFASENNELAILLGSYDEKLYLSLKVVDEKIIYAKNNAGYSSDTLVISFRDNQNRPRRIFVSPYQPGKVSVKRYVDNEIKNDDEFIAYWEETDNGFNFEMAFPQGLKPRELRLTHFDVENKKQETHARRISTSGIELNPLVWPSQSIIQLVSQIQLLAGQRLWVLDVQGRAIARKGQLTDIYHKEESFIIRIADWLLSSDAVNKIEPRDSSTVLSSPLVYDALNGKKASMIESIANDGYSVASVATPIIDNNRVIGAVFIEENIASNQLLQRKNLAKMIALVLLIIISIILLIIWYISRVSSRITHLKNQINLVVDDEGRINSPVKIKAIEGDEIDDLSNAFAHMGAKLYDYNDYLEKLASRLSHELRTPIAIVRSSLDNLLLNCEDSTSRKTIERALIGTERLGEIISRMRQASGVKNAMQTAQFEEINFTKMLAQLVSGFSQSFPEHQFKFESNCEPVKRKISTDLMAELLDKLLSNAMDFSRSGSVIIVALNKTDTRLVLSVSNQGELIAKKNQRKIFQSLISIRENKTSETPNLGLGLYVVKLIANFHHAKVKAENLADKTGVKFSVIWKL